MPTYLISYDSDNEMKRVFVRHLTVNEAAYLFNLLRNDKNVHKLIVSVE